jgi:hypothetical protein
LTTTANELSEVWSKPWTFSASHDANWTLSARFWVRVLSIRFGTGRPSMMLLLPVLS